MLTARASSPAAAAMPVISFCALTEAFLRQKSSRSVGGAGGAWFGAMVGRSMPAYGTPRRAGCQRSGGSETVADGSAKGASALAWATATTTPPMAALRLLRERWFLVALTLGVTAALLLPEPIHALLHRLPPHVVIALALFLMAWTMP